MSWDAAYYEDLQGRTRAVLIGLGHQIPAERLAFLEELIDANECGAVFELMTAMFDTFRVELSVELVETMLGLAHTMRLDDEIFDKINAQAVQGQK